MNTDKNEKKTVLIVDDDPFLQGLFRRTLEREGFKTISAVDGLAAVEMLPDLSADLIVLDLMLPRLHGLKVLEAIRADSRHKDLPVLILSNAYLPEIAQKAMKAGATRGMPKAECSPARLVGVIRDLLGIRIPNTDGNEGPAAKQSFTSWLLGSKSATPDQGAGSNANAAEPAAVAGVKGLLMDRWHQDMSVIRQHCLGYVKTVGTQESTKHLNELYRGLRFLGTRATMGGCPRISQLTDAFQAMLFERVFQFKDETSPSMLQTIAQAVDCLEHLFKTGRAVSSKPSRKARVLLVDDNPVCNMACEVALRRADFESSSATDGAAALALLKINSFDLILLDIDMPGLNGFEVCEKIRALPQYAETPIIFVTLHSNFQNRAQGVLSGANGLIAKPISPLELIVKIMVFLLRSADQKTSENSSPTAGAPQPSMADAAPQKSVKAHPVKEKSSTAAKAPAPADREAEAQPAILASVPAAGGDSTGKEASVKNTPAPTRETKEQCTSVTSQVQTLAQSLRSVFSCRTIPETETKEPVTCSRVPELEPAPRAAGREKSRAQVAKQQKHNQSAEQSGLEARAKQLAAADTAVAAANAEQATAPQQMQTLTKSLKTELGRRETAEKQAAELAARRTELERELAQRTQAQEKLSAELAQQQKRLEAQAKSQQAAEAGLAARAKELEAAHAAVKEANTQHASVIKQLQTLTESLKTESGRREAAEKQATELAARRAELERDLAKRKQAEEKLRAEIAEQQKRLEAQARSRQTEQASLAVRTTELEAAQSAVKEANAQQASVTKQVQTLTQSLARELGRREAAEKKAAELVARRAELERELSQRAQTEDKLRAELADQHSAGAGESPAQTRTQLAQEAERRAAAEGQVRKLAALHSSLEQELAQQKQVEEHLRRELDQERARLQAQVRMLSAERSALECKTRELEAAQGSVATLHDKRTAAEQQLAGARESLAQTRTQLAQEAERRAAAEGQARELAASRSSLEQELAQQKQVEEHLRRDLDEHRTRLQAEVQTLSAERSKLKTKAQELQAAQAGVAELQDKCAAIEQQLAATSESLAQTRTQLAQEAERRAAAEGRAGELTELHHSLEQELAQRKHAEEQLRRALDEKQIRLETEAQMLAQERSKLEFKTRKLEAAQAAVAELQDKCAAVERQFESLSQSLAQTLAHLAQEIPSPAGESAPAAAPLAGGGEALALKE